MRQGSEGKSSEKGIYLDAEIAYKHLVTELNVAPDNIIVYGESLGGAVAVDLASQVKVGAVILEGTFSNGKDMGKELYPYIPKFMFPNIFDSLRKIKDVGVPKLFIHSKEDTVVPLSLAKRLYNAASEPKSFVEITGEHGNAFLVSKKECMEAVLSFINQLNHK